MPRTAFALPCAPDQVAAWRRAAAHLLEVDARAHRRFLGDRGIFRERIWLQQPTTGMPLTLVLWDCDDVDRARRAPAQPMTAHERWWCETVLGTFHGDRDCTVPQTRLLAGTTTMATAVAGAHTLLALPIPPGRITQVRALIAGFESSDHERFLTSCSVREEWIWVQPAAGALPDLLLLHLIGDDLDQLWTRLADPGEDPGARVVAEGLMRDLLAIDPTRVAADEVQQLIAMHIRRSDTSPTSGWLGSRIGGALTRRRWAALEEAFHPVVRLHDRPTDAADAVAHLREVVVDRDTDVTEVLLGHHQIMATMHDSAGEPLAVLFEVESGAVSALRVMVDRRDDPASA